MTALTRRAWLASGLGRPQWGLGVNADRDIGAGEGIRTLDPNLGKVVLYH